MLHILLESDVPSLLLPLPRWGRHGVIVSLEPRVRLLSAMCASSVREYVYVRGKGGCYTPDQLSARSCLTKKKEKRKKLSKDRKNNRIRWKNNGRDRKLESNDSPDIPERVKTSRIPKLLSGFLSYKSC